MLIILCNPVANKCTASSGTAGAGVDGLQYTREWLERAHEALEERTEGQELFHTSLTDLPSSPASVLHGAFVELLNWTDNVYPEVGRLRGMAGFPLVTVKESVDYKDASWQKDQE